MAQRLSSQSPQRSGRPKSRLAQRLPARVLQLPLVTKPKHQAQLRNSSQVVWTAPQRAPTLRNLTSTLDLGWSLPTGAAANTHSRNIRNIHKKLVSEARLALAVFITHPLPHRPQAPKPTQSLPTILDRLSTTWWRPRSSTPTRRPKS